MTYEEGLEFRLRYTSLQTSVSKTLDTKPTVVSTLVLDILGFRLGFPQRVTIWHTRVQTPGIADQRLKPYIPDQHWLVHDLELECGQFWKARFQWVNTYWLHLCKLVVYSFWTWVGGPRGPNSKQFVMLLFHVGCTKHTHTHTHTHTFCCWVKELD